MASTVLFQNTKHILFGFGSWLFRIALLYSLQIYFRDSSYSTPTLVPNRYAIAYCFFTFIAVLLPNHVDDATLLCIVEIYK